MSTAVHQRAVGVAAGRQPGAFFSRTADLVLSSDDADQSVRWRPGERLHDLFEQRCDRFRADGDAGHLAVAGDSLAVTYDELDARANRMARFLRSRGVLPGDRIALLFDDPLPAYVGMLAASKANAAYVPLDPAFPPDRLAYMVDDARVAVVLTLAHLRGQLVDVRAQVLCVDEDQPTIDSLNPDRLSPTERGTPAEDLCYVIYTSGTTGRPKGVAIEQASICNFVRAAAEVYGVQPEDRMYQGMTIAFDFSVEEIWVPLVVGATLVPKPGRNLLGEELTDYLRAQRVTALCCVPTLLATIEDTLPELRFLLVSGEACPQDLVARWYRPDRRFLNVYGPTEATVTATWTTVAPDQPVTIGVPLPTYSVLILAERDQTPLPPGELGEIAVAGVGLSPGYVNRDDLTAKAFLPDFLGIPNNTSGHIYRTGDLGRITPDGRVECLGRIDTQVKIRGYRIELTEIESVLLGLPGISQAVVDRHEPTPGVIELVAYYTEKPSGPPVDVDAVDRELRSRLPAYMVPTYFQRLDAIPMLPSDKADRKQLPAPRGARRTAPGALTEPDGELEHALADEIAGLLGLPRVSVEADFFDELGMNSLLLAQLCGRLRHRPELPPVRMKDLYVARTVRRLAPALKDLAPRGGGGAERPLRRAGTAQYLFCGALQAAVYVAVAHLVSLIGVIGFGWLLAAPDPVGVYLRAVAFTAVAVVILTALPVLAKWVLIGRWKPATIPIWSLRYVRFWIVRQLLAVSPALAFVGSPLYSAYLRLLGARVGSGAVILSGSMPVCADLITIGPGALVRKDSSFTGYRAESGWIHTGPVSIGADAVIGEATVLDIGTAVGDGAQLGHTSSLQSGQRVPPGRCYHGSPAQETTADYRVVAPLDCSTRRRVLYSLFQLFALIFGWGAISSSVLVTALPFVFPRVAAVLDADTAGAAGPEHPFDDGAFYLQQFLVAGVLFFGAAAAGLVVAVTAPRLLARLVRTGHVYRLYGVRYGAHRALRRLSNLPFFHNMLGDSSFIVGYLRAIGYDLGRVEQTGSNFGLVMKHDSPVHTHVGTGTIVSDGLSVVNADYSSTSFTVSEVSVGARSFYGNAITYPAQGHTGDNCLLGTKAMVPVTGPLRQDVGLLGSPPFEIPRSVPRDAAFDRLSTGAEFRKRLARKTRHNAATIAAFLLLRWLQAFVGILILLAAVDLYDDLGISAFAIALLVLLLFTTLSCVLAERLAIGFRRLTPQFCSIYEPYFWRHERLWKLSGVGYLLVFNGTPFKSLVWRLLGVRVGKKLFDDGCTMPEKTMVTIGDHCTLGSDSTVQCHSLEDGSFKSDHITIGDGCTVGRNTYVHYGVRMGARTVLDADSFLMKGEQPSPDSRWRGNPAGEMSETAAPQIPAPRRPPAVEQLQQVTQPGPARTPPSRPPGRNSRPRPGRSRRNRAAAGVSTTVELGIRMFGIAALLALAAVQIVLAGTRVPPSASEAPLVDGALAAPRWPDLAVAGALDETVARVQLVGYASLTGASDRYPTALLAARELAGVAAVVLLIALVVLAWRLRARPIAIGAALGLLAMTEPAAAAVAAYRPGLLGAMWLVIGGALLVGGRPLTGVLGAVAVVAGVLTAPVLAGPAALAVAVATRRWALRAAAVAAAGAGFTAVARWLPAAPAAEATTVAGRLLLTAAAVLVLAALALPGLRGSAAVAGTVVLLAAMPWPGADAVRPALLVAMFALCVALADELARWLSPRAAWVPGAVPADTGSARSGGDAVAVSVPAAGPDEVAPPAPRARSTPGRSTSAPA